MGGDTAIVPRPAARRSPSCRCRTTIEGLMMALPATVCSARKRLGGADQTGAGAPQRAPRLGLYDSGDAGGSPRVVGVGAMAVSPWPAAATDAIPTQAVAPTHALKRLAATETRTFSWDVTYWMPDEFFLRRHFQVLQLLSH